MELGLWVEAESDYGKAIERGVDLDSWQFYSRRGLARAQLGQLAEADADFARAATRGKDIISWFYHALLRLHLGGPDGYRSACAQMLAEHEESENPVILQWIVIIGDLAPDAVADPTRLVRAAERMATVNPKNPWSDLILGRALYRAGRYEETVKRFEKYSTDQNIADDPYYCLFLALAHQGLGHANDAQAWLRQAESLLDGKFAESFGKGGGSLVWYQRLETGLLLREARALIREGHPLYLPANVFLDEPTPAPPRSSRRN
jgi:tetratricopeptide (TPR) repeat protein